ncbi:MAG TPA: VWA domain-containing protein [Vicinamibacterales bacterium]|nr:VWA domain-containing protein [Vicinamibacterales bacterium]
MIALAPSIRAQQPAAPVFRASVELVTVDASVLDADGRPIETLTAADFRLEVDGRERAVTSAQFVFDGVRDHRRLAAAAPATHFSSNEGADAGRVIVVAVDEAHIRRLEGKHALVAATRFIESLPETDRVGVVGLTNAGTLTLSRDRAALRRDLERMTGIGDPMTQQLNLGISEAIEIAEGSRARLADAVLRECGRALTEYVNVARAAEDGGGGRDACPEQVEQESRAMAQYAHMQAGMSLGALQSLIERLRDLPGPKTLVLISEGMIVDPRRVDLSQLAAQAQAARVTIYGLQLEIPTFEAAQDRVSPTAARDLNVRHDGISRIAGAARGTVFRQVGTDPKPFERLDRELSGYYLLAFEARESDRDGRPHRIRVSLARGRGRQLRARTNFTLPPVTPASRGAELTALLRSLSMVTELPLRVATYAYAEPDANKVRVVISAEAGNAPTPQGTWLGFVLIDGNGVIAATATHQSREGRYSFSTVVPAGTYELRAAAIDPLGRQGSVARAFRVQPGAANELHVGDLMLAPLPAAANAPLEPFVDRVTGAAMIAYLETHSSGSAPRPDAVRVTIVPATSTTIAATGRASVSVRDGGWAMARTMVPIAALAPGAYVARAELLAGGAVVARTARPFTISR